MPVNRFNSFERAGCSENTYRLIVSGGVDSELSLMSTEKPRRLRHRNLNHDLRAGAHARQEPGEVAGSFRFRDVDHMVSHSAIIALLLPVRSSTAGDPIPLRGRQFAAKGSHDQDSAT
jgi:hypothetical protein